MTQAAIGIMCKAPRPGATKTRLGAVIGAEEAARLSACFLRDVATTIGSLSDEHACRGYAVYAPAGGETELRRILPASFGLLLQVDSDFGNVLHGAVHTLLAAGHDGVILVNGDSPTLPPRVLTEALVALRRSGDRLVLGPASDGGYYLIGLKHPHRHLFTSIPWGTAAVARTTLERAQEIALEAVMLPEWYDIDDAETLGWLREELAGRSTRFRNGASADATRRLLAVAAVQD